MTGGARRVRVGICILPDRSWSQTGRRWRRAEELGFDHAWTYDHLTWAGLPGHDWFAAIPTLAAAAGVTSRIGLGTFVTSPNNHHPAQLIREFATLDDLSGGRMLLGAGSGGTLDAQTVAEGIDLRTRTDRFADFTVLLDLLLHRESVTWRGSHYAVRDAATHPGPLNTPDRVRVPLLVAANGPRAVRLAVGHGDGWITYGGKADDVEDWWRLVGQVSDRVDAEIDRQGRDRPLRRVLGLDSSPVYSLGSLAAFEDAVTRAERLGFTDVVCVWPRESAPYAGTEAMLERIAGAFLSD